MERNDIIRMAREHLVKSEYTEFGWQECHRHEFDDDELVRFAALVAAAEREACAKVCEEVASRDYDYLATDCAAAIRARGEACSSAVKESLITAEHDKPFNFAKQCDIDGLKETYITAMRRAENALQRLKEMGEDINDIRARGEK